MSFLILGGLLLLISTFLIVASSNYALNNHKDSLLDVKEIKKREEINNKIERDKKNTPIYTLPGKRITNQIKDHMLIKDNSEKFVEKMFDKIGDIWFQFRSNSSKAVKRFVKYLISLTKPIEESENNNDQLVSNNKVKEIKDTDFSNEATISKPQTEELPVIEQDNKISKSEKSLDEATISIVGDLDESKLEEMGLFEKMENRILKKLQKSGMSDYDIWLELGDLYVKYNETKKAMEIYALVLKHSTEDLQKEKAMNKLIGL